MEGVKIYPGWAKNCEAKVIQDCANFYLYRQNIIVKVVGTIQ